jgi:hypothetical protein
MNDPEFERAFVVMSCFLGERIHPSEMPYASLSCRSLVRALSLDERTARARTMAPELLRIRLGLDRTELR